MLAKSLSKHLKLMALILAPLGLSLIIQVGSTDNVQALSSRFCEDYAHGYASRKTGGLARSTVRGAGAGALIGGIADGRRGARRGAAVGAGVGLVAGSGRASRYDVYFDRAFRRCTRR
jgi:hypothetical protein